VGCPAWWYSELADHAEGLRAARAALATPPELESLVAQTKADAAALADAARSWVRRECGDAAIADEDQVLNGIDWTPAQIRCLRDLLQPLADARTRLVSDLDGWSPYL
jgi:cob(I)alamin adenosyltransferase